MNVKSLLENKKMIHAYQPMWNLNDWTIFGYEALLRIPSQWDISIEKTFIHAREQGILYEFDTASIIGAITNFPLYFLKHEFIFINIFPSTLLHPNFERFIHDVLKKYPEIEGKVVFELNETIQEAYLWDMEPLKKRVTMLKKLNFQIALDDIGKGISSIHKVIELNPDYIKLDRYFSENLYLSKDKQKIITLIKEYCQNRIGLILEGIETDMDLAIAKVLKVPIAQGYLLGKPEAINTRSVFSKHWVEPYMIYK